MEAEAMVQQDLGKAYSKIWALDSDELTNATAGKEESTAGGE